MASTSFREALVLGLYTESPLHCGAESGVGYVDLPVQRERHTEYPVIPGSTIKGRLKDETKPPKNGESTNGRLPAHLHRELFGAMDSKERTTTPGSVSFGDGVLAVFPVRSADKPFRWVTCPFAVERVLRMLGEGRSLEPVPKDTAWVKTADDDTSELLLEEIVLTAKDKPEYFETSGPLARLLDLLPPDSQGFGYTRKMFLDRLTVVSDQDFGELAKTGTEVITRIKLTGLGTTTDVPEDHPEYDDLSEDERKGNLFVEEVVPPEALFAAAVRMGDLGHRDKLQDAVPPAIQLGGGETIGRGVTHVRVARPGTED